VFNDLEHTASAGSAHFDACSWHAAPVERADKKGPTMDAAMANPADDTGRRFCDLVMKGGITSGIVFPTAVARLSTQYRFRHIGGTSAGAIAAAGAAAAEFRRATDATHPTYGFERLGHLPRLLGERPDGRHSRLFALFAPEPAARRHFAILGAMLNRSRIAARLVHGGRAAVLAFPLAAMLGAVPGVLLLLAVQGSMALHAAGIVIAALLVAGGAIAGAFVAAALSLARGLPAQAFGLARGHARAAAAGGQPPLTDWLYDYLQDLAGKPVAAPLTFGDLDSVTLDAAAGIRGIDLEMMTTALSLGRPYSLPFATEQFYFRPDELALYFPDDVVAWIVANPGARSNATRARDEAMLAYGYRPLPTRATLPVIVAVRMSLAFPVLLSAVPLYRYAWEGTAGAGRLQAAEALRPTDADAADEGITDASVAGSSRYVEANVRRVLFSDGGICSNFPVQMFDAVLPGWPTFGINLRDDLTTPASAAQRAYLPPRGAALPPEDYAIAVDSAGGLLSFGTAIVRTMQNWRDNLQRAAPGFRDRVLTIRHTAGEGGLNLDMAATDIDAMAASGDAGAQKLIDAFARPADVASDHFTYHRWVRVRSLLAVLQRMLRDIHQGATVLDNHPPYPDLIRDAPAYVGASYRLSDDARSAAVELLDALDALDRTLATDGVDFERTAPRPEVELRIQPVI
jgi:predicted acylesterase/phospholipase RssA